MAAPGYTFNPLGYVSRSKSPLCDVLKTYAFCERQRFDSCELSQPAFGSHFLLCKRGNCIKGDGTYPGINTDVWKPASRLLPATVVMKTLEGHQKTESTIKLSRLCICLCVFVLLTSSGYYRGADKSLARPTSRCILFDGENISFDASLVIYINITNIPPIMIINRIHEHQNLQSL
jgi:hypothetical protein